MLVLPKLLAQTISPSLLYIAPKTSKDPFDTKEISSRSSEFVSVVVPEIEPPIKTFPTVLLTRLCVTIVV